MTARSVLSLAAACGAIFAILVPALASVPAFLGDLPQFAREVLDTGVILGAQTAVPLLFLAGALRMSFRGLGAAVLALVTVCAPFVFGVISLGELTKPESFSGGLLGTWFPLLWVAIPALIAAVFLISGWREPIVEGTAGGTTWGAAVTVIVLAAAGALTLILLLLVDARAPLLWVPEVAGAVFGLGVALRPRTRSTRVLRAAGVTLAVGAVIALVPHLLDYDWGSPLALAQAYASIWLVLAAAAFMAVVGLIIAGSGGPSARHRQEPV